MACRVPLRHVCALSFWTMVASSQQRIDWLTIRECEEIVESLPLFQSSVERGECPD